MYIINIIDDEKLYRESAIDAVKNFFKNSDENYEINSFINSNAFLMQQNYGDFIILDIDMPGLDGIEMARKIRNKDKRAIIIFITQMAQYAINGYEVDAIGFLVKPLNFDLFSAFMTKGIEILEKNDKKNQFLVIDIPGGKKRVTIDDILYIEVMGNNLTIHTKNEKVTTRSTLKSIENKIDSDILVRCNSCYMVNLNYVDSMIDDYIVIGSSRLKISRSRKKNLLHKFVSFVE